MKKEQDIRWNKSKSFTVALLFCVVGVVVTTFAAIDGLFEPEKQQPQQKTPVQPQQEELRWKQEDIFAEPTDPVEKKKSDVPVPSSPLSQQPKSSPSAVPSGNVSEKPQAAAVPPASAAPSCHAAVRGRMIKPFSGDELVYDETMQDWRTHNGADYEAAFGEDVRSICAGKVTEIEQSVQWGTVVTVTVADNMVIRYCGLAEKTYVRKNDEVTTGTVLGKIRECPAEIAAVPHLHLEIEKDGKTIDPKELIPG